MNPNRSVVWALLLSFAMLFGCTNDKDHVESQINEPPEAATHTVIIENMSFTPDTLNIQSGDTVEWINRDIFTHDVTSLNDRELTSGILETDDRYRLVLYKDFEYLCSFHPSMTGVILVN